MFKKFVSNGRNVTGEYYLSTLERLWNQLLCVWLCYMYVDVKIAVRRIYTKIKVAVSVIQNLLAKPESEKVFETFISRTTHYIYRINKNIIDNL